jgi:hypothetical protein
MRRLNNVLSLALTVIMMALPWAQTATAGQGDINLFAGGDSLAPNVMILLDSSGSMNNPPSSGGSDDKKDIAIDALPTLTTGVNPFGTPLSASILDVGRYFAAGEAWGTLDTWGTRTSEPAVSNPFAFSCRQSFAVMVTDGDPRRDAIAVGGFFDTIGDFDNDNGEGENGTENLANVGTDNIEWADEVTKAMFERDFNTTLEGFRT